MLIARCVHGVRGQWERPTSFSLCHEEKTCFSVSVATTDSNKCRHQNSCKVSLVKLSLSKNTQTVFFIQYSQGEVYFCLPPLTETCSIPLSKTAALTILRKFHTFSLGQRKRKIEVLGATSSFRVSGTQQLGTKSDVIVPRPNHLHNVTVQKRTTDHNMFVDINTFDEQNIS